MTKEKFTGIHWNVNFIFHTYHLGFRSVLRENALIFLKVYSSSPTQRCIMRTRYLKALENKRLSLATFLDASASSTHPARMQCIFADLVQDDSTISWQRTYKSGKQKFVSLFVLCKIQRSTSPFPWYSAEYSSFIIDSESSNYTLHVAGYSGDAGDGLNVSSKPEFLANERPFSTFDRANDINTKANCAAVEGGGWWYGACSTSELNRNNAGRWGSETFDVQASRMMMRPTVWRSQRG